MNAGVTDMIGTIYLYRCHGSRSCNEYPLITTAKPTDNVVTYTDMKFTEDTIQNIVVKEFSNWTWYNLAELKSDDGTFDEFYWITGASRSSTISGAIRLNLYWNAPTTIAFQGVSRIGMFQAFPTQSVNYNARVTPVSGENVPQKFIEFPDILGNWTDPDGVSHRLGWVMFTTSSTPNVMMGRDGQSYTRGGQTCTPTSGGHVQGNSSGYWIVADIAGFNVYGFPILLDQFSNPSSTTHVGVAVYSDSGDVFIRNAPTVWDIMSDQGIIGFKASDVVDVSFSYSCPYKLDYYGNGTDYATGDIRPIYSMRINPDGSSTGTNTALFISTEPNSDEIEPCYFICRGYTGSGSGTYRNFLQGNLPTERTYESSAITIDNRYNQMVQIRDYSGTLMQDIPLDMFTVSGNTGTLPFTEHVHADYDGMFRHIIIGDADSNTNMQIVLHEPKLPYTSSAWQEYKDGAMQDDRNAVISNLAFSIAGTAVGGVAGGALMGAVGSAGAGQAVGIAMGNGQAVRATMATGDNLGDSIAGSQLASSVGQQAGGGIVGAVQAAYGQHVKERAIQRQPATVVSMGYGLGQVIVSGEYPPGFMISYPRGTTDSLISYISNFGFPVQSRISTNFRITGYYQGIVYSDRTLSGPKLDELNNCLMQGVKMVTPYTGTSTIIQGD